MLGSDAGPLSAPESKAASCAPVAASTLTLSSSMHPTNGTFGLRVMTAILTRRCRFRADLSQTIVQKLKKAAGPATSPKYVSPEAHDVYLRGRYLRFASDDSEESRKYFEKAIQLQPDYAAAWSGLADSYGAQAVEWQAAPQQLMERAEWAARHALWRAVKQSCNRHPRSQPSFKAMSVTACLR